MQPPSCNLFPGPLCEPPSPALPAPLLTLATNTPISQTPHHPLCKHGTSQGTLQSDGDPVLAGPDTRPKNKRFLVGLGPCTTTSLNDKKY